MDSFDVIVAGGGYAGTYVTKLLSEAGEDVLMVDRRFRAGYPPQSTSGIARSFVEKYGLPVKGESTPITSFRIFGPRGTMASIGDNMLGELGDVMVEPDVLARMEADSINEGATVVHGSGVMSPVRKTGQWEVNVVSVGGNDVIRARAPFLMDATGYLAWVARSVGMFHELDGEDIHGGVEITVPRPVEHPEGEVRMWVGHTVAPNGYAWAFPSKENGEQMVRVGIGTPRKIGAMRGNDGTMTVPETHPAGYWFQRFLEWHPEYQGQVHHRMGGQIPTMAPFPYPYQNGLFLLGDAARVCCPLTGGGIMPALETARAASAALTETTEESHHIDAVGKAYVHELRDLHAEMNKRWMFKQVIYGLNDYEISRLVRFLGTHQMDMRAGLNPFMERAKMAREMLWREPRIALSVLTRGRWHKARHPWQPRS